jgi:hypothetical protein
MSTRQRTRPDNKYLVDLILLINLMSSAIPQLKKVIQQGYQQARSKSNASKQVNLPGLKAANLSATSNQRITSLAPAVGRRDWIR